MEFEFKNEDEITLPDWIGGSKLTLAEIGAVAVFACLTNNGDDTGLAEKISSSEMKKAVEGLKEKGVFKVTFADGEAKVEIDLDVAKNEEIQSEE